MLCFKMAGGKSKHIELSEESGEKQGYLQKVMKTSKAQDRKTDGKVIVLLDPRHNSPLLAWNNVRWALKIHVSYSSWVAAIQLRY